MKLFRTHGLWQDKGMFGCRCAALKCRAKKLLRRVVTGYERLFQKAIGLVSSVFTRKFQKQTREAVNGGDATRDSIRKRHYIFEIGHTFVHLRHMFGFIFGNFLTGIPFCRKNRKIVHKSRLKAFIRCMIFFSREAVGMVCFWKKHRMGTRNSCHRMQPKEKARRYEYGRSGCFSLLLRRPLVSFRSHFEWPFASGTCSRRGLASFRQDLQCLCEAHPSVGGRICALLREKAVLFAVPFLFIAFLCFGAPVAPAAVADAPKSPQKITKANQGSSSNKASAKAPTKGTTPLPDAASPNTPAPNAEPKEIKNLKSYCKHHPNEWEGFYNLGIEQYKLMDYAAAQQSFAQALQNCSDPKEQEKIFYNLGNAGFRFSQSQSVDQQVLGFKESLQNYENALAIDKEAKDTQHNIEVVKRYLKRAEKQQQQEQQNKKNGKDDNKNYTGLEKDKDSSNDKDKDKNDGKDKDDKDNQKDQQDDSGDKNVDLEQKEMDNILNRAKKVEKMLPPSSLNPQSGGKDPVIRDW